MGIFITLEGGEGSGKTSHGKTLASKLENFGHTVCLTREPGGTPQGERIRGLFLSGDPSQWFGESEAMLAFASRFEHWRRVIEPALLRNEWVICDRFLDSTYAYQGFGRGVCLDFLDFLTKMQPWIPTRTYIFDCPPGIGLKRSFKRLEVFQNLESRFESFDLSFHNRVRAGFFHILQKHPKRCHLIDATKGIDEVWQNLWDDVTNFFSGMLLKNAKPQK